jgi:hypothetical protein
MMFQDWVERQYDASASRNFMSIGEYVDLVVRHQPSVQAEDEIYEPVTVNVMLSGFDCVPLQTDFGAGWYSRLQAGVANMMSGAKRLLRKRIGLGPMRFRNTLKNISQGSFASPN